MAITVETFDGFSVGAGLPTGWTSRWDGGTWSIVDSAGDKFLRKRDATAARYLASWNAIDADSDRANSEVLVDLQTSVIHAGNAHCGVVLRGSGTGTSETGYVAHFYGSELRISMYNAAALSQLAITSGFGLLVNTKYRLRFRANGTALKAKIWLASGSEPGSWTLETTSATISAAGWTGCFGFSRVDVDENHDFWRIAVATNGDTATYAVSPDGSVTGGTGTGTGTGTGGDATGIVPGYISGGTGTGTGTGTGGDATGITITLDGSYERSSVDLANSSVTGAGDSAVIAIKPKVQESEVATYGIAWHCPVVDIVGVNGFRPTFRFLDYKDSSGGNHGYSAGWPSTTRPMYSYDDGLTWLYFDTNVTRDAGNQWIEFRNSAAFTADRVRISRHREVTVHQVGDWLDEQSAAYSSFFKPSASALAYTPTGSVSGFAGQTFIADEFSTQVDSLGSTVPVTPFYAAEINDTALMPASGFPKRVALIDTGVHAGEGPSWNTFKSFVAYLCGSSADAQAIRREYRILLYPCMNAPGKAGGGWRGSWTQGTAGADDANRHYSDTGSTLEIVDKPKAAQTTDRAGAVPDWVIDFHTSYSGLWGFYELGGNSYHTRWKAGMLGYGYSLTVHGSPVAGFTETYWRNLGTKLAVTSEQGETNPVSDAAIVAYGETQLKVIKDLMDEGAFFAVVTGGTGTGTGSGTGGDATGQIAGVVSGGVGAGTGAGSGGDAVGEVGGSASVTGGTGTGIGSGAGGNATGVIAGEVTGGTGVGVGSGTGGEATGTSANAYVAGGAGTGAGAGTGGDATGIPAGTVTSAPNGSGPTIIRPQTNRPLNVGGIRI